METIAQSPQCYSAHLIRNFEVEFIQKKFTWYCLFGLSRPHLYCALQCGVVCVDVTQHTFHVVYSLAHVLELEMYVDPAMQLSASHFPATVQLEHQLAQSVRKMQIRKVCQASGRGLQKVGASMYLSA